MRRRLLAIGILAGLFIATSSSRALAGPDPSPSPDTVSVGAEREVVAVVNGEETRYLAPARTQAELQAQIDAHLKQAPGGVQINENEIAYDGGKFIMTFAKPGQQVGTDHTTQAASDCTSLWYCFYDGVNFTYPRGRFERLRMAGHEPIWLARPD